MHLKYLSLAILLSATAVAAQDWADPDHPEIDYSGVYGQLASENGYKEMIGWWSYGDDDGAKKGTKGNPHDFSKLPTAEKLKAVGELPSGSVFTYTTPEGEVRTVEKP